MKNFIKQIIILILVVSFSVFILFYMKKITNPYIVQHDIDKVNKAAGLVLPGYIIEKEMTALLDNGSFSYRTGVKNEDGIDKNGFVFISVKYGYYCDIKSIVGVDEENRIIGISILQQAETTGTGTRLPETISTEAIRGFINGKIFCVEKISEPWFQEQFRGIDLNKKIKILNIRSGPKSLSEDPANRNEVYTFACGMATTKLIIEGLKEGIVKLQKARSILKQNDDEEVK